MVCASVRRDTNHALSHFYHNNQCRPSHYGVSPAKDRVSVDCGTTYLHVKENQKDMPIMLPDLAL